MEFKDLLIIIIGLIILVLGLSALNNFIGGNPFFIYVGTPLALGVFVIVGGWLFTGYVSTHHT